MRLGWKSLRMRSADAWQSLWIYTEATISDFFSSWWYKSFCHSGQLWVKLWEREGNVGHALISDHYPNASNMHMYAPGCKLRKLFPPFWRRALSGAGCRSAASTGRFDLGESLTGNTVKALNSASFLWATDFICLIWTPPVPEITFVFPLLLHTLVWQAWLPSGYQNENPAGKNLLCCFDLKSSPIFGNFCYNLTSAWKHGANLQIKTFPKDSTEPFRAQNFKLFHSFLASFFNPST